MLPLETKIWTNKYLDNIIEQDHLRVKQRIYPMLGFKNFSSAAVTISGIELVQKVRKGQLLTGGVKGRVAQIWEAGLAA